MILQRSQRRAHVVVLVAFTMVAMIGFLALSLDGGALLSERRHAQEASDAAALAAAGQLYYDYWVYSGNDSAGATAAGKAAAARNGYYDDLTTSKVEVYNPPISGYYIGRAGYVEVVVTYYHPRGFSSIFGAGNVEVKARSVAWGTPIAADVGILVLDPDNKDAFSASASITVNDTPIVVNSTHSEGSIANGNAIITAPDFNLTGNYATTGSAQFVGDMHVNRPPMIDPFLFLPPPDKSTMTIESRRKIQESQNSLTLYPGVYKGGISVSGVGSLFLMPGIYYMDGGGFSFSGQGSLVGNGVLIYTDPGNGNSDGISVSGQGQITLSGMTDGIYQGMTFWQRRDATVSGNISGNSGTTSITGTFYFAGGHLNVSGNGGIVNVGSQYVSNTLAVSGNGTVNVQWTPYTVGRRRLITLVE